MILRQASVSGDGVDCGRWLVERLVRVQDPAGPAVDGELVGALDHVARRECAARVYVKPPQL